MAATQHQITLYTAKVCPYAHRVEIALEEVGAEYTPYAIDLTNKPEWYQPLVNPASKVPAVAYGGPLTDPAKPSPQSVKIPESLVLLEFVADLFQDRAAHEIRPTDPVEKAKIRLFIDAVSNKFTPAFYKYFSSGTEGAEAILAAIESIQAYLPGEGEFFLGGDKFSNADIAIAPFLARLEVSSKIDAGAFKAGEGTKVYKALSTEDRFKKYRAYISKIKERESFKKTFDEDYLVQTYKERFARL